MTKKLPQMHPGEVLREEFIEPMDWLRCPDIPRTRIECIVREETAITADTAHRLARYFKTTPQFWLNLQSEYELRLAAANLGKELEKIQPHHEPA